MQTSLLPKSCDSRKKYKNRPDGTTDGEQSPLYAEETHFFRSYPKAIALAAVPEGTILGPVFEVHFVKIIDGYGIEVAMPSIAFPANTSYVDIQRDRAFLNEIHDYKEEVRSQ